MDELGYDVEWQLLNSKDFGVPQNRERVFLIGHSRDYGGSKVFPFTNCGGQARELQGHENAQRVLANTLDNVAREARGAFPTSSGGVLKVNGYHKK